MLARRPLEERLYAKVAFTPTCWLWTGCKSPNGYGYICTGGRRGKVVSTHRAAYLVEHGSIPDGLHVLHRCDTRLCVRPDHLYAGTPLQNARDMISRGRARYRGRSYAAA